MRSEKENRLGEERLNNQGCLMKVVQYNDCKDIIVEFQDKYKAIVHTIYNNFKKGKVRNPYYPSVLGVGISGEKYLNTKEYKAWKEMLRRCYDKKIKERLPTYKDVICCDEWLLFENFYNWLHSQENFDKWLSGDRWCLDKDIIIKGNKVYSPNTCCLVPNSVNNLFVKREARRGNLPIGVGIRRNKYRAYCMNDNNLIDIGAYKTLEDAFYKGYKPYKENIIRQIAEVEYSNGNIVEKCYKSMMNYKVEITD